MKEIRCQKCNHCLAKGVEIGFTKAIEKMYNDESLRQRLAKGALARALDFSWDKKIEKLNRIYGNILK